MKLVKRGGVPSKMTGVKFKNVVADQGTGCSSEPLSYAFTEPIPIMPPFPPLSSDYTFSGSEFSGVTFIINGAAESANAKWVGSFRATGPPPFNCTSGDIRYSAKKR
jgi:hypothetical protein